VGEKRWSGFGQGMSDQIGARGAGGLLAGSKWMARCASYWVGLVCRVGWVSRTMVRRLVGCISYR
jgi:hypothetical protein